MPLACSSRVARTLWVWVAMLLVCWSTAGVGSAWAAPRGVHWRRDAARAAAPLPHLNYYGGHVISQVQVYSVFWGPNVNATVRAGIGGFYSTFTGSAMFDWFSEYNTTIVAQNGHAGTNQIIGHGTSAGSVTIAPTHTGTLLANSDIQAEIRTATQCPRVAGANRGHAVHDPFPAGGADRFGGWHPVVCEWRVLRLSRYDRQRDAEHFLRCHA
jgi:hypothetical protein